MKRIILAALVAALVAVLVSGPAWAGAYENGVTAMVQKNYELAAH